VGLSGGPVKVRTESGTWVLTAWPWLVNGAGQQTETTKLRNLESREETTVPASGTQLTTCSPVWCRVVVLSDAGPVRIDLMRPDGSARQRVAGAAIADVAPLDRFEVLIEPVPSAPLSGTQRLLVYEIPTGRTVDLGTTVNTADYRNGVLSWSTRRSGRHHLAHH
jgi:hypothetical protein